MGAVATGPSLARYAFLAMGTSVELLVDAVPDAVQERFAAAEAEFHRLERIFSRFEAESELSRLNRAGRRACSPDLVSVVRLALEARERTGGRFDPTVHEALVAFGYDRTLTEVAPDGPRLTGAVPSCGGRVDIDDASRTIELGDGVRLDLGGIAKGYAVDRVASLLARSGGCLVNAGGDVAVHGCLDGEAWPIAIDVPGEPLTLGLTRGALATSGRDERRWRRGDVELHHLLDPASGRPSDSDLLRVTAFAYSAVEAEVEAKALFLAGMEAAATEADARRIPSVLVARDGRVRLAGGLA